MKTIQLDKLHVTQVDDADYDTLSCFRWYCSPSYRKDGTIRRQYAARTESGADGKARTVYMHRFILGVKDSSVQVDHRDRFGLNNQRYNLRACTRSQNQHNSSLRSNNTSGRKGVSWHKQRNKWSAEIWNNGKKEYLGLFVSIEDAAAAYDSAALSKFGEFASPNIGNGA